jgi:hypothetical protein
MLSCPRVAALPLLLLAAGFACGQGPAGAIPIRDEMSVLTPKDRGELDKFLRFLNQRYGCQVVMETWQQVPANLARRVNWNDPNAVKRFFADWSRWRIDQLKGRGLRVVIMLWRKPVEMRVVTVWPGATPAENDRLNDAVRVKVSKLNLFGAALEVRKALDAKAKALAAAGAVTIPGNTGPDNTNNPQPIVIPPNVFINPTQGSGGSPIPTQGSGGSPIPTQGSSTDGGSPPVPTTQGSSTDGDGSGSSTDGGGSTTQDGGSATTQDGGSAPPKPGLGVRDPLQCVGAAERAKLDSAAGEFERQRCQLVVECYPLTPGDWAKDVPWLRGVDLTDTNALDRALGARVAELERQLPAPAGRRVLIVSGPGRFAVKVIAFHDDDLNKRVQAGFIDSFSGKATIGDSVNYIRDQLSNEPPPDSDGPPAGQGAAPERP